ncbi:Fic family protein [Dyadobacter luticola]|uniref:Fic family protein n=1 Tax=Dyadobacter luticola TaxID=1979387 RepID=A0A5R9KQ87_9BACT|nr:Fic family protein [Dyadobacter luticola]TLU98274.1 Fic family protein [Dyadobacter luticola]
MKNFKAGKHFSQGYYKSFQPEPINRDWQVDDMQVLSLLSQADRYLGKLDMYSEYVNIDLYVRMHIAKEATQSSKIEGTRTNMEEAFLGKEDIAAEKRDDWEEVQNYISAMNDAIKQLHTLPFSSRLIRQTHKILLQGVRGMHKQPGEYRTSQNWIGGASINDAVFVPPVHTSIADLMSDIEKFAHDELNQLPDLLKVALIHYQFETIHPFLDGNGRVGRLMITLYLVDKGILKQPILYLSDYFERNRTLYYDNLMRARTHNDINQWLKFFLVGVIEISKIGIKTFDGILQLQKTLDAKIQTFGSRAAEARKIVNYLYEQPVIDAGRIEALTGKSKATNYKMLADFEKLEILREISGGQRNRLFIFNDYLALFR